MDPVAASVTTNKLSSTSLAADKRHTVNELKEDTDHEAGSLPGRLSGR